MNSRLFIDGPIDVSALPEHQRHAEYVASGFFAGGGRIHFDIANNPHSASFSCSVPRSRKALADGVADEGFIDLLKTVVTYTVLQLLPVMKSSRRDRNFLLLEHAHPSFLHARNLQVSTSHRK